MNYQSAQGNRSTRDGRSVHAGVRSDYGASGSHRVSGGYGASGNHRTSGGYGTSSDHRSSGGYGMSGNHRASNGYGASGNGRASGSRGNRNLSNSRRRQRMMRRRIRAIALLVLLIVLIGLIVHFVHGCGRSNAASQPDLIRQADVAAFAQQSDQQPAQQSAQNLALQLTAEPTAEPAQQGEVPEATAEPTPEPTAEPTPEPTVATLPNAVYRPVAEEGLLPVFKKSATDEKIIAITVDDCYQGKNLATIVRTAIDNGGKLTIFPIGENAIRDEQAEALRYAWQNGFELENHTMTHNSLYAITDERLEQEVYYQNLALNKILGVEYTVHFLRPRGGDARNDQRMQAYARQLGYYGIAHWTFCGSEKNVSMDRLKKSLAPGTIYLFHTTDTDRKRLVEFIPYAVSQGYRLVTLNEMFGYPENETAPLTEPLEGRTPPALQPYEAIPMTYKKTTYDHGVLLLQEKLIDLGYLSGEAEAAADGVYGETCAEAVRRFQGEHGLPVTGEADVQTQEKIEEAHAALQPGQVYQPVALDSALGDQVPA